MRRRCAAWGGASLGIGTLAFGLCSPSSAGCSANLVVLTHSTVTARGCATYSMIARFGIGLMVLGAVLLLGSFILAVRIRRQVPTAANALQRSEPVAAATSIGGTVPVAAQPVPVIEKHEPVAPVVTDVSRRRDPVRVGPIPPGEDGPVGGRPTPDLPVPLPPGWYGNPNNPDRPVQWWDGTKLTDPPSPAGR